MKTQQSSGTPPRRWLSLKKQRAWTALFVFLSLAAWLSGCSVLELDGAEFMDLPSSLQPRGPAAAQIEGLWWLMFWLGTIIYLIVMGYLLWALIRKRRQDENILSPRGEQNIVFFGGAIIPAIVLLTVFGFTLGVMWDISDTEGEEEMRIEVTGHQWWWEVYYPAERVETANEIHIPVGQPVRIFLTSDDVIHSFWVPQLHGKLDLNPGQITSFVIQADEPGVYWGECAEFCGVQHAQMRFVVVAESPEQTLAWLEEQSEPAQVPADELAQLGMQVFLDSNCVECHRIGGTNATGDLGPDLTHLASRRTLAAGTVDNTIGNLSGWISDPHSIKPGVLMPPSDLSGEELQALLAFLATLE